jgi:hypothetical protein
LIELGHPIGSLCELSHEQLDARLAPAASVVTARAARVPQVGLIGPNLLLLEQESPEPDKVEVFGRWAEHEDFFGSRPAERAALDVAVIQVPTLNADALERAQRAAPDCRLIAVYQFATPRALAEAGAMGIRPLQWPLTWDELMHACATPAGMPARAGRTAPRRFTDRELVALAAQAKERSDDTPRHLVQLITQLNAFADYATECSLTQPDLADVHDQIREDTSYARAQLERALALTVEALRLASNAT